MSRTENWILLVAIESALDKSKTSISVFHPSSFTLPSSTLHPPAPHPTHTLAGGLHITT